MRLGIFDLPVTVLGYAPEKVHVELDIVGLYKISFFVTCSNCEQRILPADLDAICEECERLICAHYPSFLSWFKFRRNQFVRNTANLSLRHAA